VCLAEAPDDAHELVRLEGPALVHVQLHELVDAGLLEGFARNVFHQPRGQEGQDGPEALLVRLQHADEVLEHALLHLGELDGGLPLLGLQEAGRDHEAHELHELAPADDAVIVAVEHSAEAPALLHGDVGPLRLRQLHDDWKQVGWRELASAADVQTPKLGLALGFETVARQELSQLLRQQGKDHSEVLVRGLEDREEGLDLPPADAAGAAPRLGGAPGRRPARGGAGVLQNRFLQHSLRAFLGPGRLGGVQALGVLQHRRFQHSSRPLFGPGRLGGLHPLQVLVQQPLQRGPRPLLGPS